MDSQSESSEIGMPEIRRLWMVLHGMYGNPLIDKWRTGKLVDGQDQGITSAQAVWLATLKPYDWPTIARAAEACGERHPQWPPTAPEFEALCKAFRPRKVLPHANAKQIGVSEEYRTELRERSRRELAEMRAKRAGEMGPRAEGLPGLLALCAAAVGAAGGDQATWLLEAERGFAQA